MIAETGPDSPSPGEAMDRYIPRVVDEELDELLPSLTAVSLEGPKAVGKTETALQRANSVYRLDDPAQRQIIEAAPTQVLQGEPPVLIDEWQRVPETWDVVRRAVDDDPRPGRFLLTGSASPTTKQTHSGAARIATLRMRPMTLLERGMGRPSVSLASLLSGGRPAVEGRTEVSHREYTQAIVASGFPGLKHLEGRPLRTQLEGYVRRIVETDFEQLGRSVRKPATLERWMAAFAAATATTATYEKIRDAATGGQGEQPSRDTTSYYREALEHLWIIDDVKAWRPSRNYFSRLAGAPKHHLADPALVAQLLGVGVEALLSGEEGGPAFPRDGVLLGHLFESLVTLCVRVYAQRAEATVRHFRTKGGRHEVDLIVERADDRVLALEVKFGGTVDDGDVKHLLWLQDRIGDDLLDAAIVNTGPGAYRRPDGVAVIPAALLGP